jgi:subtilisin family serine protease
MDLRRFGLALSAALWALAALCSAAPALSAEAAPEKTLPAMVPGEVVVRFADKTASRAGVLGKTARALAARETTALSLSGCALFRLEAGEDPRQAARTAAADPDVLWAEPNYIYTLRAVPDDPDFGRQWPLENTGQSGGAPGADISAVAAWDVETGSPDAVIAIIDTGLDLGHPDMAANIWRNPGEIAGNGLDDEGNGYMDDLHGWDFVEATGCASGEDCAAPDNDPSDFHGHGTHVASIAAAAANNGLGIAGVAYGSRVMPVRAGYKSASGSGLIESVDAASAIVYAAENGARVINLSFGDYEKSNLIEEAMAFAAARGALVAAAAGNDNSSSLMYPAASGNMAVMAVGATDQLDRRAAFSNYGDWVDVSAPGVTIYAAWPGAGYRTMSGTSMAAPHVAGTAALVLSRFPELGPEEVKSRVMRSADTLDSLSGMNATSGRINALSALSSQYTSPFIFYLKPGAGHAGDTLRVLGDQLGTSPGSVFLPPGVQAQVLSWSATSVVFSVPAGAQSGALTLVTADGGAAHATATVLEDHYERLEAQGAPGAPGAALGLKGDDLVKTRALPFPFPFFGRDYTLVHVCTNGYLDFTSSQASFKNSVSALAARVICAPLWDDLVTTGNAQAGEDVYVLEETDNVSFTWVAERYETKTPVNFQAALFSDGRIEFRYGSGNTGLSPTAGISGGGGVSYHLSTHDEAASLANADAVWFTPLANTAELCLQAGWNLVSFPLALVRPGVQDTLGEQAGQVRSVWAYQDGQWKTCAPGVLDDIVNFGHGRGYWIRCGADGARLPLYGVPRAPEIVLSPGWNLAGFVLDGPTPIAEALEGVEGNVTSAWGWNGGAWEVYLPSAPEAGDLTQAAPGRGYWLESGG